MRCRSEFLAAISKSASANSNLSIEDDFQRTICLSFFPTKYRLLKFQTPGKIWTCTSSVDVRRESLIGNKISNPLQFHGVTQSSALSHIVQDTYSLNDGASHNTIEGCKWSISKNHARVVSRIWRILQLQARLSLAEAFAPALRYRRDAHCMRDCCELVKYLQRSSVESRAAKVSEMNHPEWLLIQRLCRPTFLPTWQPISIFTANLSFMHRKPDHPDYVVLDTISI